MAPCRTLLVSSFYFQAGDTMFFAKFHSQKGFDANGFESWFITSHWWYWSWTIYSLKQFAFCQVARIPTSHLAKQCFMTQMMSTNDYSWLIMVNTDGQQPSTAVHHPWEWLLDDHGCLLVSTTYPYHEMINIDEPIPQVLFRAVWSTVMGVTGQFACHSRIIRKMHCCWSPFARSLRWTCLWPHVAGGLGSLKGHMLRLSVRHLLIWGLLTKFQTGNCWKMVTIIYFN